MVCKIEVMRKEEMRSKLKTVSLKTWLEILLPPAFTFLVNSLVYWGAPLLQTGIPVHNLSGRLDELVPFLPPFIIVYFGCYVFWVVNYLIIAVQEKEHRYRFFTADLYSRLICFVCFVLIPTTNTRPELSGSGFWVEAVRFLYRVDKPVNLFPSIHCMASWFCCIGLRGRTGVPKWYKMVSVVITVLVFISTLALRQHVLIDVIGGVLTAELTWFVSRHTGGYLIYERVVESLAGKMSRLFGKRKHGK